MELTSAEFEFVCRLVRERSGISIGPGKQYLVESRLATLVRNENISRVADVIDLLTADATGPLASKVVECMTTNETSFFRDRHPFDELKKHIVPGLLDRASSRRTLDIWSAACSSGQEAYSVAMLLHHYFPQLSNWNVRILATDISDAMLERTRAGRYSAYEIKRGLPAVLRDKYFEDEGNTWRARPLLRDMVETRRLNLTLDWPQLGPFDVVMLRNVLIYFENEDKQAILDRVSRVMRPDASLYLGTTESTMLLTERFEEPVGKGRRYRLREKTPPCS